MSDFLGKHLRQPKSTKLGGGEIVNAFKKKVDKSGVCPTITTRPEGFKTAILYVEKVNLNEEELCCVGTDSCPNNNKHIRGNEDFAKGTIK